jgi:hypothetical protein
MNKLFLAAGLMALASCGKSGKQASPAPTTGGVTAKIEILGGQCADGTIMQEIKGDCGGSWSVVKTSPATGKSHYLCRWAWKPDTCHDHGFLEDGRAQCYGTLMKDAGVRRTREKDCAKEFGNPPVKIAYSLKCCK